MASLYFRGTLVGLTVATLLAVLPQAGLARQRNTIRTLPIRTLPTRNLPTRNLPTRNLPRAMPTDILAAHNKYRIAVRIPNLVWSATLANNAQRWSNTLAAMGGHTLAHSPASQRPNQGENLWLGTHGFFSYTRMVDSWGQEKALYRGGPVTWTNVAQIGHYTQMVWRRTTQVGCAISTAGGNDILVCRYSPAGNIIGQRPY